MSTWRWSARHRLTFSWRPQWREPESVVTVSFEPRGDGETLMTIVHSQLPPASVPAYQRGWASVCAQLGGQAEPDPQPAN